MIVFVDVMQLSIIWMNLNERQTWPTTELIHLRTDYQWPVYVVIKMTSN